MVPEHALASLPPTSTTAATQVDQHQPEECRRKYRQRGVMQGVVPRQHGPTLVPGMLHLCTASCVVSGTPHEQSNALTRGRTPAKPTQHMYTLDTVECGHLQAFTLLNTHHTNLCGIHRRSSAGQMHRHRENRATGAKRKRNVEAAPASCSCSKCAPG